MSSCTQLTILCRCNNVCLSASIRLIHPLSRLLRRGNFVNVRRDVPAPCNHALLIGANSNINTRPNYRVVNGVLTTCQGTTFVRRANRPSLHAYARQSAPLFTGTNLRRGGRRRRLSNFLILPASYFSPFSCIARQVRQAPHAFNVRCCRND